MNFFDAVYIINLPSRPDRRAEMTEQMRLAGVDASSPRVVFFDAIRPEEAGGFPTVGARGCFMSHLGVLKSALAASHRRILILEDDLNFVHDFESEFKKIVPALGQSEWGTAYLGTLAVKPPIVAQAAVSVLPASSGIMGSHMFAIKADAIPALVDFLEAILKRPPGDPAGGPMHVDGAYTWFRRAHPSMITLVCTPSLGYQRPSRSDVHALSWFDRTPVVRDLVALARHAKARARSRR